MNKITNGLLRTLLMTSLITTAPASMAGSSPDEPEFNKRVYFGGSVGISDLSPDTSETVYEVGDGNDISKSLHLGADFSKHWTVEAYVVDLGKAEINCRSNCEKAGTISYKHLGVSAIGYFYNNRDGDYYGSDNEDEGLYRREGLSAYGRLGVGKMNNDSDLGYKRLNDIHLHVGGGIEYGWENGIAARAEVISYDTDALEASMGLIKRFGRSEPYLEGPPEVPPELAAPPESVKQPEPASLEAPAVAPAPKPVQRKVVRIRLPRLYFAIDDHHLSPLAQRKLRDLAETMKRYPQLKLEIRGYTDATASEEYNLNLSLRRAAAVRRFMAEQGISPSRFRIAALSELEPAASNDTAEGRAKNRRVEFRIVR